MSRTRSQLEQSVAEARMIGPVARDEILPFPNYRLFERLKSLRADGAMQEMPQADQCSMTALLDCRATLEAIHKNNADFLLSMPGISEEIRKRRAAQCHLRASIEHLNSIINAKRIGP